MATCAVYEFYQNIFMTLEKAVIEKRKLRRKFTNTTLYLAVLLRVITLIDI
jgi:hypothetical protein